MTKQEITSLFNELLSGGWADEHGASIDDVWNEVAARVLSRHDVAHYHEGRSSEQFGSFMAALREYAPAFELWIWGFPDPKNGEEPVVYQVSTGISARICL